MSESLESLLAGRQRPEPPEISIIKQFVEAKFKITPGVTISERSIIIVVRGASLAGALRPYLSEIQTACNTTKRLVIRIQ